MKLCKDCVYFGSTRVTPVSQIPCRHNAAGGAPCPVIGDRSHRSCQEMRRSPICGPEARLFEPKKDVWWGW